MDSGGGGGGGGRRRVSRETSPDRARANNNNVNNGGLLMERSQGRVRTPLLMARRVQIVYYLSRNGQLEHPHFMELSQLPNHHLRLKDVMERLTVLRGKGMPSLYSWSCKRGYKNGYVWNDLSENDVIYPAEGAEYVLKGSEIILGCSEQFRRLRVTNGPPKPLQTRHQIELEDDQESEEDDDGGGEYLEHEHVNNKSHNLTLTTTTATRCSRGVSTDEITTHVTKKPSPQQTEIALDDGSPPSSSSSDPAVEPSGLTRGSVFLNLISCGSAVAGGVKGRKSGANVQKAEAARVTSRVEDEEEVRYMSENPRFGNLQAEDKEYFSGSIVLEAMRGRCMNGDDHQPAGLMKSTSYNEERSSKLGIAEECLVVGEENRGGVKGKCIPGRKKSNKQQQQQQLKD